MHVFTCSLTMTPTSNVPIFMFLVSIVLVSDAITDGLLPNGNFESGPKSWELNGTQVIDRYGIPEWEISGFVEYIKSGQRQGDMILVVPEGAFAVRLGNEASIRQRMTVTVGSFYSITFSAARTCAQQERLNVSVTPDFGVIPIQTIYSSNGWDSYAWGFRSVVERVELVIHNPGVEEDPACGPLVDSVNIKTLFPPTPIGENLVLNGDFEEGPYIIPNTSSGVLIPPNTEDKHTPLPGWLVVSLRAVRYIDATHFSVPQGQRAIELLAGRESAIGQVVPTVPGKLYLLIFAVGDARNTCPGSMVVEAFADGETVKVPYRSTGSGGFKRAMLRFRATQATTRVMFYSSFYHSRSDATLCGPVVDDVRVVAVAGLDY